MHLVTTKKLGLPQEARQAFDLLHQADILSKTLADKMKAMVGFCNIAVHDYQAINPTILINTLNKHLTDFTEFIVIVRQL